MNPADVDLVPFGALLVRGADAHPDRDCLVFPDARRTYGELRDRAVDVGRSLIALGVEPGDSVGILMANCIDFADVLMGTALIGAVSVPLNARFKARELGYVIENGDLKVLFTSDIVEQHTDYVALLHSAVPGLADAADPTDLDLTAAPALRAGVLLGSGDRPGFLGRGAFDALADRVDPAEVNQRGAAVRIDDIAVMFYTSGTTAMPKGCPLTHQVMQWAGVTTGRFRMKLTGEDRLWDPLPMFHTAFLQPFIAILDAGGTYLTQTHFEPGPALEMIRNEDVTALFTAFPALALALLNHPDYTEDTFRNVRVTFNVAPPDALRAMQARMPHTTQVSAFGMTETGGSVTMTELDDDLEVRGTQGRALPGIEIEIRDPDTNEPLPPGGRGEIVVRGAGVFSGYYKAPEKTAETVEPDGWFHTGDLATMDAAGRLTFQGRLKDMLKVGGENVAAVEIESFISTHPSVSQVEVVGVPDEKYMEVAAAFIELLPGTTADEDEIIEFCRGEIASFKVPRYVRFVTEWPVGATKVLKYKLRDQICEELGLA